MFSDYEQANLPLCNLNDTVDEKVHKVYKDMYGGDDVAYSNKAE
jgi:formyltetrahydrofolate synthetase